MTDQAELLAADVVLIGDVGNGNDLGELEHTAPAEALVLAELARRWAPHRPAPLPSKDEVPSRWSAGADTVHGMKVAVPAEIQDDERRVALVPDVIRKLLDAGLEVSGWRARRCVNGTRGSLACS